MEIVKAKIAFGIGIAWVAFWVGLAFGSVGDVSTELTPTPSWMPVAFLIITGVPFALGILTGRRE